MCGSPDSKPGHWCGKLDRQVQCLLSLCHGIECGLEAAPLPGATDVEVIEERLEEERICLWAEKPLAFGSDLDLIWVLGCSGLSKLGL